MLTHTPLIACQHTKLQEIFHSHCYKIVGLIQYAAVIGLMYILGLNSNYIARELVSYVVSVKLHLRDGRTDGQTVRLLDEV